MTLARKLRAAGLSGGVPERKLGLGFVILLIAGVIAGCGLSGDDEPAPTRPRLLTVRDLDKYPSNSPEAAMFRHFFFIQWGSARDLIATLDPLVTEQVGLPPLVKAYAFVRPGLAAAKFRVVGKTDTSQGKLITYEILPQEGKVQAESALLGRAGNSYVILYDSLLESAIPESIRATAAAQPSTKQLRESTERSVTAVMRRFHATAGPEGPGSASKRAAGRGRVPSGDRGPVAREPGR